MSIAADLSQQLQSVLGLDATPVAIRYVTSAPAGVPVVTEAATAGCSLWRRAEQSTFFSRPSAHRGCAVGMFTQGLSMEADASDELMGLIGQMDELGYLSGDEVPSIPTVPAERTGSDGGIVEGPLAEVADGDTIDAVLVWAKPSQAMILNEALGAAAWGSGGTAVFGRPACAALPVAMRDGKATISLGCAGMRTFTEIADDRMLITIPGTAVASLGESLASISGANDQMRSFHESRR